VELLKELVKASRNWEKTETDKMFDKEEVHPTPSSRWPLNLDP